MHPKLMWVSKLTSSLSVALPGITYSIQDTVDPLKKVLILNLGDDLSKTDYNHVQKIVHAFSNVNDCTVSKICKGPKMLTIEVLTKTRLGPEMNKSPFECDKADVKEN